MLIWVKELSLNICLSGQSSQSAVCTGRGHPIPRRRFSEKVDRFMGVKGPDRHRNSDLQGNVGH